ncbi:MAG: hypothetical protein R6V49_06015 [Bacteroidales bacterium]
MTSVRNASVLCCVLWMSIHVSFAQERKPAGDSTLRYENVEGYSSKRGFTRFMYRLFYDPAPAGNKLRTAKQITEKSPDTCFQGKVIRHIYIQTLDPFGNSARDTVTSSLRLLTELGNICHLKTHPSVVANLLLFRSGHTYDSLLVNESERLVRSMQFVTDVSFFTRVVNPDVDSVDVFIRVLDIWSIVPAVSLSSGRFALDLGDDNLIGSGHAFHNKFLLDRETGDYVNQATYFIPNIGHTFIHSILQYGTDEFGNFNKLVTAERSFFSPYSPWAAGVGLLQQSHGKPLGSENGLRYKLNAQDFWLGSAVQLFEGNSEYSRTTRFVTAARFARTRYTEKPLPFLDTAGLYEGEDLYLVTFALSSWQFIQDQFVFKFGLTEDIPVGKIVSFTTGYQLKNNEKRAYFAAGLAYGNYHPWGYLRPAIVLGTFVGKSGTEEGVFGAGVYYFSGLIEAGGWRFRQFIKSQVTLGMNRLPFDSLSINNELGITGFNSPTLSGASRLLFSLQTQSYPPWNFIGFDFGPFFTFSLGILGDKDLGFRHQKIYTHFGLGVLVKNQRLLMNTFQFSISYYPEIPGQGFNLFKINSFHTNDFGLQGFEIGKPATLEFR